MTQAIAYARVSTRNQQGKDGPRRQLQAIQRYAKRNDLRITKEYTEAYTGTTDQRPVLSEALNYLEHHTDTILVVETMDRLARKLHVQEAIIGKVWDLGRDLHTVDAGPILRDDPSDPMRTAMRQMMGVFAELDRSMGLAKRTAGQRAKIAAGGYGGGRIPYGYMNGTNKDMVPNPAEQATIHLAKTMRARGDSLRLIGAQLALLGHLPRSGESWHPTAVRALVGEDAGRKH